jgi:hypothetical protein
MSVNAENMKRKSAIRIGMMSVSARDIRKSEERHIEEVVESDIPDM